jgi:hypothetical protein
MVFMEEKPPLHYDHAWLTGRETHPESSAYGEVVVPAINIRTNPGSLPKCGRAVGQLQHGARVDILDHKWDSSEERYYYKISANEIIGWVPESFIAWDWSCFTFLGSLQPPDACRELDVNVGYAGMEILMKQSRIAVVTEGDPKAFDSIYSAVSSYLQRIIAAQTPLSVVALQARFTYWVEVPMERGETGRTVGFMDLKGEEALQVTTDDIQTAQSVVPLMAQAPYLDLALRDLTQAWTYPQHALIFLARAIESIENFFGSLAGQREGIGKEKLMQKSLGVKKSDVEYIMKRANAAHRRHASPNGTEEILTKEELTECFKKTNNIIVAFVNFLEREFHQP